MSSPAKLRILIAAAIVGFAGSVQAQIEYRFISEYYTDVDRAYTTDMHLELVIRLADALEGDALTQNLFQLPGFEFSWSDGMSVRTDATFQTLDLTTNADGKVSGWEILFSDGTPFYTVSARSGDLSPHVMVIDEVARSSGLRFDAAGTWAVSAVPEPASVFLMGMPLVAFAGYRLRSALRADRRIA